MLNPLSLRRAVIIAALTMLVAGGLWATERKRDENKPQNAVEQSKESSVTILENNPVSQAPGLVNNHSAKPADLGDEITVEFVRIPAGSFYIGPAHHVQFTKPFYMGKYEVTQAQWKSVMGTTVSQQHNKANSPWRLKGEGPDYPIYYVSWEEAVEFCNRLGGNFRLPAEAEWEYACRAGSKTRFHYGDDPDYSQLDLYAWYYNNSEGRTHPVGRKKPNPWGLYDMYGNVSEWCSDRFSIGHVCRGGSWLDEPKKCQSAYRDLGGILLDEIGFRVVFTGNLDNDKKLLEITLPKDTDGLNIAQEQKPGIKSVTPLAITGVVRDQAGIPVDGVYMKILPWGWILRDYPEGRLEAYRFTRIKEASIPKYHFLARHLQRNLVAFVEFNQDVNTLDIKLEPGAILAGKVVDPHGKGIPTAKITTIMKNPDWQRPLPLFPYRAEVDVEGKFETRALPLGYKYSVTSIAAGYRINKIEFQTKETPGNRIDAGLIVLDRGQFSVSGVVVDKNRKPVANAVVYCSGENQIRISSRTDTDGRFTLDGIFEGPVEINAYIRGDNPMEVSYGAKHTRAGATNVMVVLRYKTNYGHPQQKP